MSMSMSTSMFVFVCACVRPWSLQGRSYLWRGRVRRVAEGGAAGCEAHCVWHAKEAAAVGVDDPAVQQECCDFADGGLADVDSASHRAFLPEVSACVTCPHGGV